MSELPEPTERTADSYADIFDALEIAFWHEDLDHCDAAEIPLVQFDDETMSDCKIRSKRDYDVFHGCPVIITHFKYNSHRGGQTSALEYVKINWINDDETNLLVSIHKLELGYYSQDSDTDGNSYMRIKTEYFDYAKGMAKTALGAVSAI